jgi:hypothetical protein
MNYYINYVNKNCAEIKTYIHSYVYEHKISFFKKSSKFFLYHSILFIFFILEIT